MRYRSQGQRIYGNEQSINQLRHGLILHIKPYGSGLTAPDISGYGYHGSLLNGASHAIGQNNKRNALQFDGVNDVCSVTGFNTQLSGSFSFSAWVKYGSTNLNSAVHGIITSEFATNYWAGLQIYQNKFTFALYDGTNNPVVQNAFIIASSEWWHICGVRDTVADTITLYVNGILAASATDTTNPAGIPSYSNLNIGRQVTSTNRWYEGLIDDARIYGRALSAAEVALLASPTTEPVTSIMRRSVTYDAPVSTNQSKFFQMF
jgi:hypothetical protein